MKTVLAIGSSNADKSLYVDSFPAPGETLTSIKTKLTPGGKGANQAIALARARADVLFLTSLGEDSGGAMLKKTFEENGLPYVAFKSEEPTGSAYIAIDAKGENKIILEAGANGAFGKKGCKKAERYIKQADIVLVQNELPIDSVLSLIQKAHELGKVVVYNPAPYKEIPDSIFPCIDYLIPNESELAQLVPDTKVEKAADILEAKGVKHVIVTVGDEGCYYEHEVIAPYAIEPIDTVGAGDTFVGYFVMGLAYGLSDSEAIRLANKAAAISCLKEGAIPAIPTYDEVLTTHLSLKE